MVKPTFKKQVTIKYMFLVKDQKYKKIVYKYLDNAAVLQQCITQSATLHFHRDRLIVPKESYLKPRCSLI